MPQLGKSTAELEAEQSKAKADAEFNASKDNPDIRNNEPSLAQTTPPQNTDGVVVTGEVIPSSNLPLDKQVPLTEVEQVNQQLNTKLLGIKEAEATKPLQTQPSGSPVEIQQHVTVTPMTEGHSVTIFPNTSGRFKFKAVCNCAWQGLFDTQEEAIERAKLHKKLRNVRPF